jgi:NTE family protein
VAGIAWEIGVLLGITDAATDLTPPIIDAELVVGTSAGSTVAAQICSGTALLDLFDTQLAEASSEIDVDFDAAALLEQFASAAAGATSAQEVRRRVGAFSLAANTVDEQARRGAIAGRLPSAEWSDRRVLIPAIDAETGEMIVFTRDSDVPLVDAVAASSAVPGVWPPVTINGRRYIDGGVRSATNADLAAGSDRVLVITPAPAGVESPLDRLPEEIETLRPAEVLVIHADDAAIAAFGNNPLSPTTRRPSALAGRTLGRAIAEQVTAFWA